MTVPVKGAVHSRLVGFCGVGRAIPAQYPAPSFNAGAGRRSHGSAVDTSKSPAISAYITLSQHNG